MQEGEPSCPQWQVGHSYAAEALRELGRAAEAAEHLQSALTGLLEQPLATTPEVRVSKHFNKLQDSTRYICRGANSQVVPIAAGSQRQRS